MSIIGWVYTMLAFALAMGILVSPAILLAVWVCKRSSWTAKSKVTLARLVVFKSLILDPLALTYLGSTSSLMLWCRVAVGFLPDWLVALAANAIVWGFVVLFLNLVASTWRAEMIRRRGTSGFSQGVAVRYSHEIAVPAVAGLVRPSVLLPKGKEVSPTSMAHELAHIRNRDLHWMFLTRLFAAVYSLLPWVHRLASELLLWQEILADDASAKVPGASKRTLANEITGFGRMRSAGLLAMSGEGIQVSRRILYLYRRESGRSIHGAWLSLLLVIVTPSIGLLVKPAPAAVYAPVASRMRVATPVP